MEHNNDFINLINDIKDEVKELTVLDLKDKIKNNKEFYLVDIREDNEVKSGIIKNAIHLSKGIIERDINKLIPNKDAEIILYCSGGYRSILAAYNLNRMGYRTVYSMKGGLKSWIDSLQD